MLALLVLMLGHWLAPALGAKHSMFVGNLFDPYVIHALEFDDTTHDFHLVETMDADASHAWLAFDKSKSNIYGTSLNETRISSYKVTSPTTFLHETSIESQGECFNTTSAFVEAAPWPPYTVYSASWPGRPACGMAMSVDESGTLDGVIDTWSYAEESGIHGIALRKKGHEVLIYSADLNGNSVWTHKVESGTGKVTEMDRMMMPREDMEPRHLTVHPSGSYVYVLMEAANSLLPIRLDKRTGLPKTVGTESSLIPEGVENDNYWSAEVMLSPSGRYLWATARTAIDTDFHGHISCFLLSENGSIIKQMFMVNTTTTGGWANAVAPAFWSDEYIAMTDTPTGYVQMWKMEGRKRTHHGVEYDTATAIARVDIGDGGCCANVIWHS